MNIEIISSTGPEELQNDMQRIEDNLVEVKGRPLINPNGPDNSIMVGYEIAIIQFDKIAYRSWHARLIRGLNNSPATDSDAVIVLLDIVNTLANFTETSLKNEHGIIVHVEIPDIDSLSTQFITVRYGLK